MADLRDIARHTGFSISVVSRALNPAPDKNARVAQSTHKKIIEAAEKLNYRPNRSAEFLRKGKSASIGVFLPKTPNRLVADLMFGISEQATKKGFPLNFYFGMTQKDYKYFIKSSEDHSLSGIITYPFNPSLAGKVGKLMESYYKKGGNIVVLNTPQRIMDLPCVSMDEYRGGEIAAEYLLAQGVKCLLAEDGFPKRTEGFISKVKDKPGIFYRTFQADRLKSILGRLKNRLKKEKLGVFTTTDVKAVAAMKILRDRGLAFKKKVFLIGYDDLYLTDVLDPPLTTIHQPFYEQGVTAVKKVINMIYGKEETSEYIEPYLVKRGTA